MLQHQHPGLPAETCPVGLGTPVAYADERIGWVDEVVLDGQQRPGLKEVVVRPRGFFHRELVVPIERVRSVDDGGVWLDCDPRDPARLRQGRGGAAARGPSQYMAACVR